MTEHAQLDRWLLQTGSGDMEAFEQLYRYTEKNVFAYILSIVKNNEMAKDIFQDTYIKIRSASRKYQTQKKPLAWIFTIAKNTAYDSLKKESRAVSVDYQECEELFSHSIDGKCEDSVLLAKALNLLSLEERQIVFLYAVSGFKHKEIAGLLELPLGTVLWKYNKAIKRLSQEMKD